MSNFTLMTNFSHSHIALSFVSTNSRLFKEIQRHPHWQPWLEGLDQRSQIYYRSIYHGNFFQQAFQADNDENAFRRWRLKRAHTADVVIESITFTIRRIEVYLTQSGFNLFTVVLEHAQNATYDEMWGAIRAMRSISLGYNYDGVQLALHALIAQIGTLNSTLEAPTHIYIYQNHTYHAQASREDLIADCHRLANFLSRDGSDHFQTSTRYFDKQIALFSVDVYASWFALSLNDSFVRLSQPESDTFNRWLTDYFTIYLYNVCLKSYLSFVNSSLANVTGLSSQMERTKNDFVEFLNDTQYQRISSKFLPNDIFEIIGRSLGVPEEMQILEKKLDRISAYFKARRDKAFNTALIVITFLSMFTVILDISVWFERIGFLGPYLWPVGSILTACLMVAIVILFFIIRMRK